MSLLGQFQTLYFFTKRFCKHQKQQKHQKHKDAQSTKCYKQTKIKNVFKKHLRGKKSLICLFAFLGFLCAQRKENKKKRKVPTM